MRLKIGLTGGIGSGKSTVANLFHSLYHIPLIDADVISHQLVQPNQPALLLIHKKFGASIINPDGTLNRNHLRDIIFSDPDKKKQLEAIIHPLVYQEMQSIFDNTTAPYSLLSIPLLMETQHYAFVDRILVVDCSVETQIERVKQRDQLSDERILSIIASQVSRQHRLDHADDIISNTKSSNQLAEHVKKLHNQYLNLAKNSA
jgi:dephospho-CoA kinase